MEFSDFRNLQQAHIDEMVQDTDHLFVVDLDKDELWSLYLDSFPEGTNEIFRERREFDCSCCRQYVKSFGNVVKITEDNDIETIWDFQVDDDDKYSIVVNALSDYVKSKVVRDVHVSRDSRFGVLSTHELLESGGIRKWNHFRAELPQRFVVRSSENVNEVMGTLRDNRNVFKRSLEEITPEALETVLDMIAEGVLYRGDEWQAVLSQFKALQDEYLSLGDEKQKNNFAWRVSVKVSGSLVRLRNTSMGTLLNDLSAGTDVITAIKKYEAVVAPANYKRPKPIYTKKMVEEAEKKAIEMGFENSFCRRHAQLEDITINNVLWANKDAEKQMSGLGVFELLKEDIPVNPNKFKNINGVPVDSFVEDMLPTATEIEVLFEQSKQGNLVSLIAPENRDAKTMFKWNNSFSWSYRGNITDSPIKENVRKAGGKVDGVLRFSLQWNDKNQWNQNDYDAHCIEPNGNVIYYGRKRSRSGGNLDVDIIHPKRNKPAVENIVFPDTHNMKTGVYRFLIHNYSHRGGTDGFDAELEFDGVIHHFSYHRDFRNKVSVVDVEFNRKSGFKIVKSLGHAVGANSKEIWGIKANQWQRVSSIMFSPNYWDEQGGIGNKHLFFMLAGCENDEQPNGFYNEYLHQDLNKYRKVFEALGSKMKVEPSDNQLSGLGFSSTKRSSLICKVDGKVIKVIF